MADSRVDVLINTGQHYLTQRRKFIIKPFS